MDRRENEQFSLDSNKWSKRTLKSSIGGFSQPAVNQIRTLQGLLAVIQLLQLKQFIGSQLYHEEFLGEGVSYKVFRCQLAVSRKVVALKQVKLPPPDADIDAFRTRVSCVLKDIEVMNHAPLASHPHIIDLLGYGWNRQGSIPFLVTEWARHETMRQLLQGTSLSARQKLKLCRHVALALLELHLCGIAHGDVKLDNVLIVRASRGEPDYVTLADDTVVIAKLADFGHSVLLNPGEVVNADASQKYRGTVA
ncbi:hypothetical protein A1O3_03000 [Capronia epimyces CBS 606.96]|uniref:Serine/threonine-protein kinase ATG1 n=1 Tax=Capronia epimyces CBS 606.96 TaxID=1182542 RepID=W9YBR5_9EURO|nr:uncharacterized protein A1O3_03000 [Capronia epimyces CBS 606.96]EXJ89933.1 hypothetical protein A1O3_03000 [Capronia epimyces CBS 606.96]